LESNSKEDLRITHILGTAAIDGMKVVVAEDDAVARTLIQKTLQRWKYEVFPVTDGEEAWNIIRQHEAPMLITDLIMPKMDGLELCRRIRSSPLPGYTYIIVVTALNEKQDVIKGFEAGADDYLVKPFDTAELRARMRAGERIINLEKAMIAHQKEIMRGKDSLEAVNQQLKEKIRELEAFNRLAVGREMTMIELKRQINELCERCGEKPRYSPLLAPERV
jgi:DNA-binding response OmpR family regulator